MSNETHKPTKITFLVISNINWSQKKKSINWFYIEWVERNSLFKIVNNLLVDFYKICFILNSIMLEIQYRIFPVSFCTFSSNVDADGQPFLCRSTTDTVLISLEWWFLMVLASPEAWGPWTLCHHLCTCTTNCHTL